MQRLDTGAIGTLLASTALATILLLAPAGTASRALAQSGEERAATLAAPPADVVIPPPAADEAAPAAPTPVVETRPETAPPAPEAKPEVATPAVESRPEAATPAVTAAEAPTSPVLEAIRKQLSETRAGGADQAALQAFYAKRSAPLWTGESGFNAAASHAMAEIAKADDWGLEAKQFELPSAQVEREPRQLAAAEIKLSLAALKYARHARGGRVEPLQLSPNLDQKLALRDPAVVLESLAQTDKPGDYLLTLHPQHEQFRKLRLALLKARGADSASEPEAAPFVSLPDGPTLKSGSKHAQVPLLRKRLGLNGRADDDIFDAELAEALKAFQRDKGLQATGQLTPRTRQVLNAGAPKPVVKGRTLAAKLVLNMERWRWMPEDMGAYHVWQNTPEYTVRVIKDGAVVHQARVVVGKVGNQTPVFSARMQYVIFHPEWGVPDSIKVKEILPYLKPAQDDFFGSLFGGGGGGADTRVLQKHNLRVSQNGKVVDASQVDWSQADIRRYTFIQPAGSTNVLGVVKFRFPNKHDVYMHDTPQRDLFSREVRTFSHGCVRVQNPVQLAEVLLAQDKGWTPEYIKGIIAAGQTQDIELTNRIPVHLSYFTTVAAADGSISVFDDIYGHDARLSAALAGRYVAPEPAAEASAEAPPAKGRKGKKRPPVTDNLW
ncbi:MAG: L,D-transpeptidase family protein [Hyphomicrobiaceae bacterium]|nr:L,D-transpeptidase family protein [Hyphomicrobiaceae bacterium]